jgi:hypothetical protein
MKTRRRKRQPETEETPGMAPTTIFSSVASVSSTARSLLSPLPVCSRFIESSRGNKSSFKRICPSSSGIAVGVSAIGVVVVSATKKRQQSGTAATAATAHLRSYGRRAAMIVLSSAAAALLLFQQVPIMHGLEFPKSAKDEYDDEEERLVELFEGATRSVVSVQNVEAEVSKVAMKQTAVGEEDVKVEGIGSGFIWDKFGHIVSHMVSLPMLYPHILRFSHFVLSLSLSLSISHLQIEMGTGNKLSCSGEIGNGSFRATKGTGKNGDAFTWRCCMVKARDNVPHL